MNMTRMELAAASIESMITMMGVHAAVRQAEESLTTATVKDELIEEQAQVLISEILQKQACMLGALGMAAEA